MESSLSEEGDSAQHLNFERPIERVARQEGSSVGREGGFTWGTPMGRGRRCRIGRRRGDGRRCRDGCRRGAGGGEGACEGAAGGRSVRYFASVGRLVINITVSNLVWITRVDEIIFPIKLNIKGNDNKNIDDLGRNHVYLLGGTEKDGKFANA